MYQSYWGLTEKPFENTPDPKYIYYSAQHKEAMARILYVVRERKGAALLTGEYGSGKTLLSRILSDELKQEKVYQAVFILNPRLSGVELLKEIVWQLTGTAASHNKVDLFHSLQEILIANHRTGRHTVIVVDEAQAIMSYDVFEELRLLLNFQLDNAFLLTLVLMGQPELKTKIFNMPQLGHRMAVKYHLNALNEAETKNYVIHRLEVVRGYQHIFTEDAYEGIYFFSTGIPRRINNICDLALLVGYGENMKTINREAIVKVGEELDLHAAPMHDPFGRNLSGLSEPSEGSISAGRMDNQLQ
jgi:general secretion pathway protein A